MSTFQSTLDKAGWSLEELQGFLDPSPPPPLQTSAMLKNVIDLVSPQKTSATLTALKLNVDNTKLSDLQNGLHHLKVSDAKQKRASFPQNENRPPEDQFRVSKQYAAPIMGAMRAVGDEELCQAAGLDETLQNGWTLYPHQKEAVESCIKEKRSILAFDMGLGKTMISLLWAKAFCRSYPSCSVLVVAPCTLLENWKREADVAFHGFEAECNIQYCSWAKITAPAAILSQAGCSSFVLICDEAHAMQTLASARTRAALALCKSPACRGCILATGKQRSHICRDVCISLISHF